MTETKELKIREEKDFDKEKKITVIVCSTCKEQKTITNLEENVIKQWVCKKCLKKIVKTPDMNGLMLNIPINVHLKEMEDINKRVDPSPFIREIKEKEKSVNDIMQKEKEYIEKRKNIDVEIQRIYREELSIKTEEGLERMEIELKLEDLEKEKKSAIEGKIAICEIRYQLARDIKKLKEQYADVLKNIKTTEVKKE